MLSTLQIQYNSLNGYTTVRMFTDSLFGHTIPNPESKDPVPRILRQCGSDGEGGDTQTVTEG